MRVWWHVNAAWFFGSGSSTKMGLQKEWVPAQQHPALKIWKYLGMHWRLIVSHPLIYIWILCPFMPTNAHILHFFRIRVLTLYYCPWQILLRCVANFFWLWQYKYFLIGTSISVCILQYRKPSSSSFLWRAFCSESPGDRWAAGTGKLLSLSLFPGYCFWVTVVRKILPNLG